MGVIASALARAGVEVDAAQEELLLIGATLGGHSAASLAWRIGRHQAAALRLLFGVPEPEPEQAEDEEETG